MAETEDDITVPIQPATEDETVVPHVGTQAYATRKTVAQGMLDLALLIANASQMKGQIDKPSQYYILLIVLLSISVALQLIVGIIIVILGNMDVTNQRDHDRAQNMNNATVGLVLFITIINVFTGVFEMQGS